MVNDAQSIADTLRQGGFDVVYAANAGKAEFAAAVQSFAGKIEPGSVAMVCYYGHALQYRQRNFLIPIDAKIASEADIGREAIDMDSIIDPLIVARTPASVAVVDASRENPWQRLLPGGARGLAAQEPLKGITVIYPAAPGKTAPGDLFAAQFIKAMKTPGLGFDAVLEQTRAAVARASGGAQAVWQSSPAPKNLVILSAETPGAASDAPSHTAAQTAGAVELGFWDTIKNSDTPLDFQIYLDSYPNGQFVEAARARLAQLQGKKPELPQAGGAMPAKNEAADRPAGPPAAERDCPVCPEIVPVPAGSFEMGAADGMTFERPLHRVSIQKPFYIGRREVTFDEWDVCVNEGGCRYRPGDRGLGRGLRPVTDIDWNDAKSYLVWLSAKTGKRYRLPTEAEWEYAARAGTRTAYAWGNALEKDRANCVGCTSMSLGKAVETGTFPANGLGLFDMAGNAAEWVEDCWNETYKGAPADGSAWTKPDCRERVLRGGSFNNDSRFVRSSARFKYDYDVRYYANGFRVARD
jgi:formylglycine-generating enzyme required for sulfatase activity